MKTVKLYTDTERTARVSASTRYISLANYILGVIRRHGLCEVAVMGHVPAWEAVKAIAFASSISPLVSTIQSVSFVLNSHKIKAGEYALWNGVNLVEITSVQDSRAGIDTGEMVDVSELNPLVDGIVIYVERVKT